MRYVPGTRPAPALKHEGPLRADARGGDRRAGRARRSTPRTPPGSCTATSSPPTCCSPATHAYLSDFGLTRSLSSRGAADRDRPVARHHRLRLARAAAGRARRRARGRLLARLRAPRGADRPPAVPARDRARHAARPPPGPDPAAVGVGRAAGLRPRDGARAGQGPGATATRRPATSAGRRSPPRAASR